MLTWDENKRRTNLKSHGIDFADLEDVFNHYMDTEPDGGPELGSRTCAGLETGFF